MVGCILAGPVFSGELDLAASQDTFGRSNLRNTNNGGSEQLAISQAPNYRTIMAFDLSAVTNEIVGAELQFRQGNTMEGKMSMVVAPMANTASNSVWAEGVGNLGVRGQPARSGEACYALRAFRDAPWESAPGVPASDLGDADLWMPTVAQLNGIPWEEGRWLKVPLNNTSLLENIRKSESPVVTFGMWGKSGNGLYFISSRNSTWPPVLHLNLGKEDKK